MSWPTIALTFSPFAVALLVSHIRHPNTPTPKEQVDE